MKNAQHHQFLKKANQNHNHILHHPRNSSYFQKRLKLTSVGEDVEQRDSLYTVDDNVNYQCPTVMKNSMKTLQKLKIELLYNPAINS
jgi:hypothetical protein